MVIELNTLLLHCYIVNTFFYVLFIDTRKVRRQYCNWLRRQSKKRWKILNINVLICNFMNNKIIIRI